MSRMEFAKAKRMELRAKEDDRLGSLLTEKNLGLQALQKARSTTRRLGTIRKPREETMDSLVVSLPVLSDRTGLSTTKFDRVHSSIHHVSQANAILRQKLEVKPQQAALTKENLMHLEEIQKTNRPAVQLQRKQEFIKKEMEKGRRSAAPNEGKEALLRMIDEREKNSEAEKKIRADSVLGDLRKAKFRHLALMAQKRLQSVSPDVMKMEEERKGLGSQIDWYLRFCGEEGVPEESRSGSHSPF